MEKYGEEKAKQLLEVKRIKNRIAATGRRVKFISSRSGNGWSGWYKSMFFRSLRELSYIINTLEENNIEWESAENKECRIEYYWNNNKRYYTPDFFVNKTTLVEIKPKLLQKTNMNLAKFRAAKIYCCLNKLIFKIIDPKIIKIEKLKELVENGTVKFTQKTSEKYCNYLQKLERRG